MSTFKGPLAEINGVSVDRFDRINEFSRAYFLSHCHSDHMVGLCDDYFTKHHAKENVFLYASEISSVILKNKYPGLSKNIRSLNILDTHQILIPGNQKSEAEFISVKLIPAGHCPGSVMFLFRTLGNKNILYTGDFRVSSVDLPKLKQLNDEFGKPVVIDKMYFDSTFWNERFPDFPSRDASCDVICDIIAEWVSKGKDYLVSLNKTAYYGSEGLYIELARRLKTKIHVRQEEFDTYRHIIDLDDVFTLDSMETQIHSCTKTGAMKSIECRPNSRSLHIRSIWPSALRWDFYDQKSNIFEEKADKFLVCYSSHGSLNELKGFIKYFKPKSIEPCVVLETKDFYKSINSFCEDFLEVPCVPPTKEDNVIETSDESADETLIEQNPCTIVDSSDDNEQSEVGNKKINSIYSEIQLSRKSPLNKKVKLF